MKRLPVTSPHGNFATVTSPQKLRHTVTSPHFEKVKGDVGIVGKCVGCGGGRGDVGRGMRGGVGKCDGVWRR